MLKTILTTLFLGIAIGVMAQTDAENLENARKALSVNRNCEDAMNYLNQISPDSRLTADYLLCMARTQDCKKNNEQAIYYYNKFLGLKPGTDSVIKRVAELKDMSNNKAKVTNDVEVAKKTYQTASKNKKHRRMNLDDNYGTSGISYGLALGGNNSPYKNAVNLSGAYGFMLMHNKAVIDVTGSSGFLLSPNQSWFAAAVGAPGTNVSVSGGGFSEIFNVGFSPVLINKKNLTLSAGAMAGFYYYILTTDISNYGSAIINDKFTFSYGVKSNLYLGEHVVFYAELLLTSANSIDVTSYTNDYSVPANLSILNLGVSYKFDSWW